VLTERETAIVARAREFAREHVAPRAVEWENARRSCKDAVRRAAREGFAGLLLSERHGRLGVTLVAATRVFEELAAAHLPFAFSLVVHANLIRAIDRLGSREQIETLLPRLLGGDMIGAFCLTEPGTGSDAANLMTQATRDGPGWRIRGEKAWVTNGSVADLASVYVQTDPARGWRGIAALLVPLSMPGIERLPAYGMLGGHAMATSGLRFVDCVVGEDAMLVPPGAGFKAAMAGIDVARVLLAGMCCGILGDSLDRAIAYARDRRAFGRPIADFQGLQWSLADVATGLAAARALTYAAARHVDAGGDGSLMAAHAKKFATRAALNGVSACMRTMGAVALRDDYPLGRHLASAQIAEYLDGTTGIQNLVIARELFR
jgi:alkylation response protein AidB-like acyl-CoA dehydrogenase